MSPFLKNQILLFVFLHLINSFGISQQTYYISNKGKDSNDGKSPELPWAGIDKLNKNMALFKPGDKILFERGGIFRGQINVTVSGTSDNPVIFGAYGSGNPPEINGSDEIKNWIKVKDNVYKAYYSGSKVTNLFINGRQMVLARYPNSGFLTITSANGKIGFKCSKLNQESQYWKGANVRVRTENWVWEARKIKSFVSGTVVFDIPTSYTCDNGWGFYLDGKLEELDSEYEWYWDSVTQYIFIYLPGNIQPDNYLIEASTFDYGFTGSVKNVRIENLAVVNQSKINIELKGDHNSVVNCTAKNAWETALSFYGSHITLDSNFITTRSGRGIWGYGNSDIRITHNHLKNIGLTEGYGITGDGAYKGIFIDRCSNALVAYNRLDSIGYAGINIYGDHSIAEKNIIDHCMLILDDGGALYGWGDYSHHNIWRNNIVYNAIGSGKAKSNTDRMALAIYLDNGMDSSFVINNSVINCSGGILNNADANYNTFIGNTVFGKSDGISFANWSYPNSPIMGCVTKGNIFYSLSDQSLPVAIQFNVRREVSEFDSNYYFNPYKEFYFPGARSFSDWNNYFEDKGSKVAFFQVQDINKNIAEIFVNETDTGKLISLAENTYITLDSVSINQFILPPFSSRILINYKKLLSLETNYLTNDYKPKYQLFPNPCLRGHQVSLSVSQNNYPSEIRIIDLNGKILESYLIPGSQTSIAIPTDRYKPGLYFIRILQFSKVQNLPLLIQ